MRPAVILGLLAALLLSACGLSPAPRPQAEPTLSARCEAAARDVQALANQRRTVQRRAERRGPSLEQIDALYQSHELARRAARRVLSTKGCFPPKARAAARDILRRLAAE